MTQRLFVFRFAVSIVCALFLLTNLANAQTADINPQPSILENISKTPNDNSNTIPHWLVGSYYTTQDGLTATLMLNNKGVQPIEVRPTIYNLAGQPLELAPVIVAPSSAHYINLSDWAAVGGDSYKQG